jgi:uncharacterized membrane protein YfcA
MFASFDFLHVIAGALVGFLVGLTGVGGGSLMTPILVLIFGVNPATAVGTDLLFASTTKIVGSSVHGWQDSVDWKVVRRLAMGSVPGAALTLIAMAVGGHPNAYVSEIIRYTLGGMLLLTAGATLFQKRLAAFAQRHEGADGRDTLVPTIVLGAVLGVAVTVSSIGAGAIGVTALLMLYPALRLSRIVGSDIAHAVPLTMVAGLGHWFIGDVHVGLLLNLLVGSVPAVIVGSLLSSRAPDSLLRPVLAVVLLIVGTKLLTAS